MIWSHTVNARDVRLAFNFIKATLDESDRTMWIVVDLTENPQFPVVDTVMEALTGSFRHERLAEWLVVGTNSMAKLIADMLTGITGRRNIKWFDTMQDALTHLDQQIDAQ